MVIVNIRLCLLITASTLAFPPMWVVAEALPQVEPETVGISSAALQKITHFTEENIASGKHVGFVTMVARHGKIVHFEATGTFGLDNDKPMQKDALFRIYSMTKPVTTVAAMMLYEEGRFQLSDPVSKYLPELKDLKLLRDGDEVMPKSEMTIEQLMTHT
ncbi:MAG: serine hydrolase domain-containing protein, partial [Pseudomonadales bacterium]